MQAEDPGYAERVRASFARQPAMRLLGATMDELSPGRCVLSFPHRPDLTQQHGYVHAGILTAVADSAGGYAGHSMMPAGSGVLSTDLQMRFLAPARGTRFVCTGTVVKAGRTLTVCELRVEAVEGQARTLCAYGTQTLIRVPPDKDAAAHAPAGGPVGRQAEGSGESPSNAKA